MEIDGRDWPRGSGPGMPSGCRGPGRVSRTAGAVQVRGRNSAPRVPGISRPCGMAVPVAGRAGRRRVAAPNRRAPLDPGSTGML